MLTPSTLHLCFSIGYCFDLTFYQTSQTGALTCHSLSQSYFAFDYFSLITLQLVVVENSIVSFASSFLPNRALRQNYSNSILSVCLIDLSCRCTVAPSEEITGANSLDSVTRVSAKAY